MRPDGCVERIIVDGRCACSGCAARRRRGSKRSKLRTYTGTQDSYVDSQETLRQLRALTKAGLSLTYIASHTGYGPSYLRILTSPRRRRERAKTRARTISARRAEAVAALYERVMSERKRGEPVAGGDVGATRAGTIPVRLTRLALQGLQAQGWSIRWIGEQLGVDGSRVYQLLHTVKTVSPETEKQVVALARQIGSAEATGGQSSRVRAAAAEKNYRPTIYVDELV